MFRTFATTEPWSPHRIRVCAVSEDWGSHFIMENIRGVRKFDPDFGSDRCIPQSCDPLFFMRFQVIPLRLLGIAMPSGPVFSKLEDPLELAFDGDSSFESPFLNWAQTISVLHGGHVPAHDGLHAAEKTITAGVSKLRRYRSSLGSKRIAPCYPSYGDTLPVFLPAPSKPKLWAFPNSSWTSYNNPWLAVKNVAVLYIFPVNHSQQKDYFVHIFFSWCTATGFGCEKTTEFKKKGEQWSFRYVFQGFFSCTASRQRIRNQAGKSIAVSATYKKHR